jgi:hypothetical protein
MEVVGCDPELGTRDLSTTDAFPLPVSFGSKYVSGRHDGDGTKQENLMHRGDSAGKTRICCHR